MGANAGSIIQKTSPQLWSLVPSDGAVKTYDFDGVPVRIIRVYVVHVRSGTTSTVVSLTVPGYGTSQILLVKSQVGAAVGSDGESQQAEAHLCLDVPAGTVLSYQCDSPSGGILWVLFQPAGVA